MDRKALFNIVDEELGKVITIDNYKSLFSLVKMLYKTEVAELAISNISLKNARKILINFISQLRVLNINVLKEEIVVDKELEDIEISYVELYDAIKDLLSQYSQIMTNRYLRPFLLGMLNSLISVYLDREMIDSAIIAQKYNQELKNKQELTKEMYLANCIKECGCFCEEVAIGFVHKEGMSAMDAFYPSSRLVRIKDENIKEATINSFIEALSYFAGITFYNRSRNDFEACLNEFRIIYQMYYSNKVESIIDLIPTLIQMNFPIKVLNGQIVIDFDELNNQINIMKESMKEKALIIK